MLSDAPLYSEHRSMQAHDTELFLPIIRKLDWESPEQETVMDIGCGSGNSIQNIFLPLFPDVKKMIGVDILPDMIDFAKQNNASDKIEYHVADIENWSTLDKWSEQISKVISVYCFNWLDNQEEAFRNVYRLLKPGGEAASLFILSTRFWDSYKLHIDNPKWNPYLKDATDINVPASHYKKLDGSYYRDLLEGLGFNVVVCEDENRTFSFADDDHCRGSIFVCGLTKHIPDDLKREFKEDLFQGFLKYNGRDSDGRPMIYYKSLTLLVQKPNA